MSDRGIFGDYDYNRGREAGRRDADWADAKELGEISDALHLVGPNDYRDGYNDGWDEENEREDEPAERLDAISDTSSGSESGGDGSSSSDSSSSGSGAALVGIIIVTVVAILIMRPFFGGIPATPSNTNSLPPKIIERSWRIRTAYTTFQLDARLIGVSNGNVTIQRTDNGRIVTFPLNRFSLSDQGFLQTVGR